MARSVDATALIRADNRRLRGDLSKSHAMFKRTFGGISRSIKGSMAGALSPLGIGFGVAGLASMGKKVVDFEGGLVDMGIAAKKNDAWVERMRSTILGLSDATGIAREEVLGAATELLDLEGAASFTEAKMRVLLDTHVATGAEMEHLAGIMFALNNSFFAGAGSAEELQLAMGAIAEAGKDGSIPYADMATILRQVAPVLARTGVTGKKAAASLSALLQVGALGAFGGPEEVGTGLTAFVNSLAKARPKLRKFGVDPFRQMADGSLRLKELPEIFDAIGNSKLAKRPDLLQKVFGRDESVKFLEIMMKMRGPYEELAAVAENAGDVIGQDRDRKLDSRAGKMKIAMNEVREAFLLAFTPERIESATEALKILASVVAAAADHAKELMVLYGAFKIAPWVIGGAKLVKTMNAASGAAGSAAMHLNGSLGAMTALGAAAGVVGAAIIGWQLGTVLDQWLGISNAISDAAAGLDPKTGHAVGVGVTRDLARDLAGFSDEDVATAGGEGRSAEMAARRAGLNLLRGGDAGFAQGGQSLGVDAIARRLVSSGLSQSEARDRAQEIHGGLERASAARAQLVEVRVSVDQRGMLTAQQVHEREERRSPQ